MELDQSIKNLLKYDIPIKEVKPDDRPENVLDRAPDEHDAVSIVDIVEDFCTEELLKELDEWDKENDRYKILSYDDYAKTVDIELEILLSALNVQRPINKNHLYGIQKYYNKNKIQDPIVIKVKYKGKWHYYIVDGQHTAATQGIRARRGLIKEVAKEDWKSVKVRCKVIECSSFEFAREVFLGINGNDKLQLDVFDKWKNYVLGARQDNSENEFWQDCLEIQEILEEHGITPVHSRSSLQEKRAPGAFVDLNKIVNKNVKQNPVDTKYWARLHQMCWDDKPVDSFELYPMLLLRNKIRRDNSLDNPHVQKFFKELESLIRHTVGSPGGIKKLTQQTYPLWFEAVSDEEEKKPKSLPDDASLALLLFMYKEAGGKFEGLRINLNFLSEKFTRRGETMFDYLSTDSKEVDEDLKELISDSGKNF